MKFKITLKDLAGITDAVDTAVVDEIPDNKADLHVSEDQRDELEKSLYDLLGKWIKNNSVTLEVDTVKKTITVCEVTA